MKRESEKLSSREELLLMKYNDGECSWFERRVAQFLLKRNTGAQHVVRAFKHTSSLLSTPPFSEPSLPLKGGSTDLWDRINKRISQEEKTSLFLGERSYVPGLKRDSSPFLSPWFTKTAWGASGAFLAASAVLYFQTSLTVSAPKQKGFAQITNQNFVPVAGNGSEAMISTSRSSLPGTTMVSSSPYEVQWLRSDGRVRLVDARNDSSSPIIIIKRRIESPVQTR